MDHTHPCLSESDRNGLLLMHKRIRAVERVYHTHLVQNNTFQAVFVTQKWGLGGESIKHSLAQLKMQYLKRLTDCILHTQPKLHYQMHSVAGIFSAICAPLVRDLAFQTHATVPNTVTIVWSNEVMRDMWPKPCFADLRKQIEDNIKLLHVLMFKCDMRGKTTNWPLYRTPDDYKQDCMKALMGELFNRDSSVCKWLADSPIFDHNCLKQLKNLL